MTGKTSPANDPVGDRNWIRNAYIRGHKSAPLDSSRDADRDAAICHEAGLDALEAAAQVRAKALLQALDGTREPWLAVAEVAPTFSMP